MKHNFRDLGIWKDSFSIVKEVYELFTIEVNDIIEKLHSNQRMIGGLKRKISALK